FLAGNGVVSAIVIDPTTPATLYAGTYGGAGVLKSTNAGGTWGAANTGLPGSRFVIALVIDSTPPTTLYAATPVALPHALRVGARITDGGPDITSIFRSTDGGGTWSAANTTGLPLAPDLPLGPPIFGQETLVLAIAPTTPATLYVGVVT